MITGNFKIKRGNVKGDHSISIIELWVKIKQYMIISQITVVYEIWYLAVSELVETV